MNISDAIADREILEAGLEDITGIYEIVWRFGTLFPSASIADKYDVADRRVRELVRGGHIRLVRQFFVKESNHRIVCFSCSDLSASPPAKLFPAEPIKVGRLDFAYGLAVLRAIISLTTNAICSPKKALAKEKRPQLSIGRRTKIFRKSKKALKHHKSI